MQNEDKVQPHQKIDADVNANDHPVNTQNPQAVGGEKQTNARFPQWDILPPTQFVNPRSKKPQ